MSRQPSVNIKRVDLKGGADGAGDTIQFNEYQKVNKEHNDAIVVSAIKDLIRTLIYKDKFHIPTQDIKSKMDELSGVIGKLNEPGKINTADLKDYSIRYNLLQYYRLLDDTVNYISREYSYIMYSDSKEFNTSYYNKTNSYDLTFNNQIEWEDQIGNYKINNINKFNKLRGYKIPNNTIINLFVIGDLEGNITLLYNWLITNKFIDENLNWIHREKTGELTLIVQCGDQIDNKDRSEFKDREIDLALLLFMDYLNLRSGGKVLSIIGNHEWWNIIKDYHDSERMPINENESIELFKQNNVLGRIINRRNFIIRIDKYLFVHGGITNIELKIYRHIKNNNFDSTNININDYFEDYDDIGTQFNINEFIYTINNQLFIYDNWDVNKETITHKYLLNPSGRIRINDEDIEIGIVFSRYIDDNNNPIFDNLDIDINNLDYLFPELLQNFIIITGHNSNPTMIMCFQKKCIASSELMNINFLENDTEYYKEKDPEKVTNIFTDVQTRRLGKTGNQISLFVLNIVSNKNTRKFKTENFKCDIGPIRVTIPDTSASASTSTSTDPYKKVCYIMNAVIYLKKYLLSKQ